MSTAIANTEGLLGIRGLLHFSLTVRDLDRSIAFYRDVLGMELIEFDGPIGRTHLREERDNYVAGVTGYEDAHLRIALLRMQGVVLELIEYLRPNGTPRVPGTHRAGSPHVAFVVEDLRAAWDELRRIREGWALEFISDGPVCVDSGPNHGGFALYFRDPDGVTIELVEMARR
jgi:catechol 2,3-dioxygenase-like lactoylglutathione lyase family enzyme